MAYWREDTSVNRSAQCLYAINTDVTAPADTNPNTLATYTIPAGTMGANDYLVITALYSWTNSANNKVFATLLGGTTINTITQTTNVSSQQIFIVRNRNNVAAQVFRGSADTSPWGASGAPITTATINMAAAQTLIFRVTKASAGETATLHSFSVEIYKPASAN